MSCTLTASQPSSSSLRLHRADTSARRADRARRPSQKPARTPASCPCTARSACPPWGGNTACFPHGRQSPNRPAGETARRWAQYRCACVFHPVRLTRKSFWSQIMFCISGERAERDLGRMRAEVHAAEAADHGHLLGLGLRELIGAHQTISCTPVSCAGQWRSSRSAYSVAAQLNLALSSSATSRAASP